MSERTGIKNRFWMLAVSSLMVLLCMVFARPVQAQAAGYKMVYEKPVKVGAYYYRIKTSYDAEGYPSYCYQRSKKKSGGYQNLVQSEGTTDGLTNSFATNGTKLYYCRRVDTKSKLICYTIKTKKEKSLKTYKKVLREVKLEGVFGNSLYVIQLDDRNKAVCLDKVNLSSNKTKRLYKTFIVWNALDNSVYNTRYLAISSGQKIMDSQNGSKVSDLIVLDKKTGKTKKISKTLVRANMYASGADSSFYKWLTQNIIFAEYNKKSKTWTFRKYTFSNGRAKTLKTVKNIKTLDSMYYFGNGMVNISYTDTKGKNKSMEIK